MGRHQLQRDLANLGKYRERTEATEFPIPLSGSVQAHLVNLGWWRC